MGKLTSSLFRTSLLLILKALKYEKHVVDLIWQDLENKNKLFFKKMVLVAKMQCDCIFYNNVA